MEQLARSHEKSSSSVKQENSENSSRSVKTAARARRCSICGNTSYNARTCTLDIDISNEEDSAKFQLI